MPEDSEERGLGNEMKEGKYWEREGESMWIDRGGLEARGRTMGFGETEGT